MVQPESSGDIEYRVLKFETHNKAEEVLNEMSRDGWQFVSYSTAGWDMGITHFIVVSRVKQPEGRRFGFGT
jgi:hypothetical protein